MKKVYKILCIIIIIVSIFLAPKNVYAGGTIDIFGAGEAFINKGKNHFGWQDYVTGLYNADDFVDQLSSLAGNWLAKDIFMNIIDALWAIGLLVIFISTIVLGIKYMFVSPNERSKIKQATTPYIIGVVVIFGALTIWRFLIILLDGSI